MESSRIGVKLFVSEPSAVKLEDVVPVFHSWIQQQALAGNLLIDVADYLHVPNGPGIVLVAHEANYATDRADGKLGLFYQRKRPVAAGTLQERLAAAFREALTAAWLLEQDPRLNGQWKFDSRRIHIRIADKLQAPNKPETFDAMKPELTAFLTKVLGTSDFRMERYEDERVTFEVRVTTPVQVGVEGMLARVQE